jgi:CBS domain-containing protein
MATERTVGQLIAGRKVYSILENDSLMLALEIQKTHGVSRLPVVCHQ